MALAKKIKIGKNEPLLDPFFFILLRIDNSRVQKSVARGFTNFHEADTKNTDSVQKFVVYTKW